MIDRPHDMSELTQAWQALFGQITPKPPQFQRWLTSYSLKTCVAGLCAARKWVTRTGKHSLFEVVAYATACMRQVDEIGEGEIE